MRRLLRCALLPRQPLGRGRALGAGRGERRSKRLGAASELGLAYAEHRQPAHEPRGARRHGRVGRAGARARRPPRRRRGSPTRAEHARHDGAARRRPRARSSSAASRSRWRPGSSRTSPGRYATWPGPALRNRDHAAADAALAAGLDYCTAPRLDLWRLYLQGFQSRSQLDQGQWTEAAETAAVVLGDARTSRDPPHPRRRHAGPGARPPRRSGLVRGARRRPGPVRALRPDAVRRARRRRRGRGRLAARRSRRRRPRDAGHLRAGDRARAGGVAGELALWRRRAGWPTRSPPAWPTPTRCSSPASGRRPRPDGRPIGRPYEEALALADGDAGARHRALDQLHDLGAGPAAAIVARRLRARGARGLRRGPGARRARTRRT